MGHSYSGDCFLERAATFLWVSMHNLEDPGNEEAIQVAPQAILEIG
jgi:hypothetical protein